MALLPPPGRFQDMFLKNLSQAFAEVAQGDMYLVVKDSVASDDPS